MTDPFVLVAPDQLDAAAGAGMPIELAGADAHHLRTVLRLEAGARLTVSDGAGRTGPAVLVGPRSAELVEAPGSIPPPSPAIHLLQGLPKGRKADDVVRVVTELGVDRLTFVGAERSVPRLGGERASRARERWEAVARAASVQARRPWLLDVRGPIDVGAAAEAIGDAPAGVVAHVGADQALSDALRGAPWGRLEVVVAVGPEGGWTPAEVVVWRQAGLHVVTLGPTVLRTEHAGVVASSVVAYAIGRFD